MILISKDIMKESINTNFELTGINMVTQNCSDQEFSNTMVHEHRRVNVVEQLKAITNSDMSGPEMFENYNRILAFDS